MRKKINKGKFLIGRSISEREFLQCLTYEEIFHLIVTFQNEKRRYFQLFLECMEKQLKDGDIDRRLLEKERTKFWNMFIHYEELVQWCFKETTKRTKIKNWRY